LESVLETAGDIAEVAETTSSGGLSALGLLGPLVYKDGLAVALSFISSKSLFRSSNSLEVGGERTLAGLSGWVGARGAGVLLDVERTTAYSRNQHFGSLRRF
jgi:hypothetical protein